MTILARRPDPPDVAALRRGIAFGLIFSVTAIVLLVGLAGWLL